jgi:hypothetical protein
MRRYPITGPPISASSSLGANRLDPVASDYFGDVGTQSRSGNCPRCGADSTGRYCATCGQSLVLASTSEPSPTSAGSTQSILSKHGNKWWRSLWFLAGGSCVLVLVVGVAWYQHSARERSLIASCHESIVADGPDPGADLEFHGSQVIAYGDGREVILGVVTGGTPDENELDALDGRELARTFECEVDKDGAAHWTSMGSLY